MNSIKIIILLSSFLVLFPVWAQTPGEKQVSETKTQVDVNAGESMATNSETGSEADIKSGVVTTPGDAAGFTESKRDQLNARELSKKIQDRIKDPFMLPNHLYLTVKKKLSEVVGEGYVDDSVEPQKRWALKYYHLVAIIWNVKSPKAMITDKKKDLHIFQIGDRIGNNGGVISSIGNGRMIVRDNEIETTLRMESGEK